MNHFSFINQVLRHHTSLVCATLVALSCSASLADDSLGTLYGIDTSTDSLVTIDTVAGVGIAIGSIGFDNIGGLAFAPFSRTLFGVDFLSDQLVRIHTQTGAGTAIAPTGLDGVRALAFDTSTKTLYGTDTDRTITVLDDDLVVINTITGAGSRVGTIGLFSVGGLTYDSATDKLLAVDGNSTGLVDIDRATGDGTTIGPLGFPLGNVASLAFDSSTKTFYGIGQDQFDTTDELVSIA